MIDPRDFVITRKRKKYKFAKFANSPLCFELDQWEQEVADVIEIGAGTGLFSVEQAKRHPEKSFVAIDVKADRLQKGAYVAEAQCLANIRFLRARADQLGECFVSGSIKEIWVTFPDPFPKRRSAGRRMTHPTYLAIYESLLSRNGSVLLKHDDAAFFEWSLEQFVQHKWRIMEVSFDLHESVLDEDYKIETSYEIRWRGEGARIKFVKLSKI